MNFSPVPTRLRSAKQLLSVTLAGTLSGSLVILLLTGCQSLLPPNMPRKAPGAVTNRVSKVEYPMPLPPTNVVWRARLNAALPPPKVVTNDLPQFRYWRGADTNVSYLQSRVSAAQGWVTIGGPFYGTNGGGSYVVSNQYVPSVQFRMKKQ